MATEPIITIRDMNVTYFLGHKQEVHALENIALTIFPGEFIIFFGPSGCGKSTLLYSIAGLETHARGTILVGGKNVATMSTHEAGLFRQHQIGMIFQAFYLISTLNILDNVVLPQMAIDAARGPRTQRAKELLEHFGVGTQLKKMPTELSGGQQQRVAICRALMNDPEIILADEPVGNLDSKSSNDVINLIHDLNQREKKTVILVTHDPSHLHLAHRVFYMRDGHIIDVKVNQAVNEEVVATTVVKKPQLPKELELLLRSFTSLAPDQLGTLLIPFKAKEIVAEAMTGMSVEELAKVEHEVQHLLIDRLSAPYELKEFLDKPVKVGGMGLDHRVAVKLAERMEQVIREVHELQGSAERQPSVSEAIRDLRHDLVEAFHLHFRDGQHLRAFDQAIHRRVNADIDAAEFEQLLIQHEDAGGVALDRRTAHKLRQRLELLLLGQYHGSHVTPR